MAWKELMEIAARRFGVVALSDARDAGLDPETVMRRARVEGWRRLHPGVYLVAGAVDTPMARTAAAVLASEGYAARQSALWLHGVLDEVPVRPKLLVPYGRRGLVSRDAEIRRTRRLPASHRTEVHGIAATTVARAIIDRARDEHPRRLLNLVTVAERRKKLKRSDLRAVRESLGRGVPGLRTVDEVLAGLGQMRSDSGWEHTIRSDLARMGFPVHPEPFPWRCEDGVVVHLDVAFPQHWVYAECDGRAFHSDPGTFDTDRVRWTQIVRSWRPVWITYQRWCYEQKAVVADIRRALELADAGREPARSAN